MTVIGFSGLTKQSLFSRPSIVKHNTEVKKFDAVTSNNQTTEVVEKTSAINELPDLSLASAQEIERAFHAIAAALRTLEIDSNMIDSCLSRLSPAQREKILSHLHQLKRNKQKTHDLHYYYTEVCLASSQQHFTNGVTPRERQLADRIMKLRERIAMLISFCHELLTKFSLLGKVQLPKDCSKSLAAIKNLGNILTAVFGGSFKYFANGFKIEAEQAIYIERNGEIYASNIEQLKEALEQLNIRLAQAAEGKLIVQGQLAKPTQQLSIS